MNSIDASEKAFSLADKLVQAGHIQVASEIRDAILGGATGLEIAFRLRYTLSSLRAEKKVPIEFLSVLDSIHRFLK